MGCLNTKLVDDEFDDGPAPLPVLSPRGGLASDAAGDPGTRSQPSTACSDVEPPNDGNSEPASASKKSCRFRFDHRVTAKYDVKALIGKGSFSRVLRVENKGTKQPYAIKMIDRIHGNDVFEAELNVLRRVKHGNVIQLVEVFESKDKVYMVMELATGGDLFDRIVTKGCFSEKDAMNVLKMVLSGLKYLHGLGITHRDMKPENLLYYHPGYDSRIMITDFGLSATRKTAEECMQTTCGTPEYIAPEILARKPYCSKVDIWAVGVIAYILLSGSMPFDDENRTRLYRQILKAKYSYPAEQWKNISIEARAFVDTLLSLDAADRPSATEALHSTWLTTPSSSADSRRPRTYGMLGRQSTRASSTTNTYNARSCRSSHSNQSQHSNRSLRSERRRVQPEELDELHRDPDLAAELRSNAASSQPSDAAVA